jgi:hypothetical protein
MTQLPSGWVPIDGASYQRTFTTFFPKLVVIRIALGALAATALVVYATTGWIADHSPVDYVLAAYMLVLAVTGGVALVRVLPRPTPEVSFDAGEVRVGRTVLPFGSLTEAGYFPLPRKGSVDHTLRLGPHGTVGIVVTLSSESRPTPGAGTRDLLAEIIRRSAVGIPEQKPDPYDPTGKFASLDHPGLLTRDEAVDFVLNTPPSGEPVRTPPRPKSIWIDED